MLITLGALVCASASLNTSPAAVALQLCSAALTMLVHSLVAGSPDKNPVSWWMHGDI